MEGDITRVNGFYNNNREMLMDEEHHVLQKEGVIESPPKKKGEEDDMPKDEVLRKKRLERLKRTNKKLFRSDIDPVEIEEFDDLLRTGIIDEIRAARGKVKFKKLLYNEDSVGDILSMIFAKLMQGAPGDSGPKVLKKNADQFAMDVAPKLEEIRQDPKFKTYRDIAAELTKRGIPTARVQKNNEMNSGWHPSSVQNIERRIEKLQRSGKIKPD